MEECISIGRDHTRNDTLFNYAKYANKQIVWREPNPNPRINCEIATSFMSVRNECVAYLCEHIEQRSAWHDINCIYKVRVLHTASRTS